jgi:uncharacterized membrane protein YcaP (DUF421 family)
VTHTLAFTLGGFMQPADLGYWETLRVNLVQLGASNQPIYLLEKIMRPVTVYLLLVYALRIFGRRILAQLNPFDLVVLLTLSNTVQNAIIGNDTSLWGGIVGAVSLLTINTILVRYSYRGATMQHGVMEQDTYLIRNHHVQEAALRKLHINIGDLTARAHERGFDDLSEVECAVLYPNGTIYMKGEQQDSLRIVKILEEVTALRNEVAALRR